jgi:hypothetical protein
MRTNFNAAITRLRVKEEPKEAAIQSHSLPISPPSIWK